MMKRRNNIRSIFGSTRVRAAIGACLALSLTVASGGCFSSDEGELYYGHVSVPAAQEFRWSDGGLPQIFDPALAAAPPDTDVVRAMFEGLTEYDPRTLKPVSGVALRWESAADDRVWTFHLRSDARWSNGEAVTAHDFVRSWRRTLRLGVRAPHAKLLANLEGAQPKPTAQATPATASPSPAPDVEAGAVGASRVAEPATGADVAPRELGVEAVDDLTLKVRLRRPDKNFPALVAHPVFRPVYQTDGEKAVEQAEPAASPSGVTEATEQARQESGAPVVTNGAFTLSAQGSDSVVLERAHNYWDAKLVSLERVRFVAAPDAEAALSAYHAGEVDAVTNVNIEPLALKLLTPYKDFRRATFGALTFYDFNTTRAPFNDRRVRQALSLAIDRQRLSADTLEGATEAAGKFLPPDTPSGGSGAEMKESQETKKADAGFDADGARRLLAEAGFPGGEKFPRIRLLVNRNEQHTRVAAAIAAMWRSVLGVETEIIERSWSEYEAALGRGDFDVARRSVVMQTMDEETNMLAMFDPERLKFAAETSANGAGTEAQTSPTPPTESRGELAAGEESGAETPPEPPAQPILTEQQALEKLPALPIYFASSYALVKPYVAGFDSNLLDAPSLKHVRIETNWQPPKRERNIRIVRLR